MPPYLRTTICENLMHLKYYEVQQYCEEISIPKESRFRVKYVSGLLKNYVKGMNYYYILQGNILCK